MNFLQKFLAANLPGKLARRIKAESRAWVAQCPCGLERSFWEAGGIRWKADGQPYLFLSCPNCGRPRWHKLYKRPGTVDPETVSVNTPE